MEFLPFAYRRRIVRVDKEDVGGVPLSGFGELVDLSQVLDQAEDAFDHRHVTAR